jgi:hypothetical protein
MSKIKGLKDERKVLFWMTLLFILGIFAGLYVCYKTGEPIQQGDVNLLLYFGFVFASGYIFISLVKEKKWHLIEDLPTYGVSFVVSLFFVPFICVFFIFWYFIKLVVLFIISMLGVIPVYIWNIVKLIFIR